IRPSHERRSKFGLKSSHISSMIPRHTHCANPLSSKTTFILPNSIKPHTRPSERSAARGGQSLNSARASRKKSPFGTRTQLQKPCHKTRTTWEYPGTICPLNSLKSQAPSAHPHAE